MYWITSDVCKWNTIETFKDQFIFLSNRNVSLYSFLNCVIFLDNDSLGCGPRESTKPSKTIINTNGC